MQTLLTNDGCEAKARKGCAPRTAIVTGSTSGIGLGIARSLASAGMNIALNGFGSAEVIKEIQSDLATIGAALVAYSAADISKPEQIAQTVQPIERFVTTDQIGALVSFLCADSAAAITGAAISIDGG